MYQNIIKLDYFEFDLNKFIKFYEFIVSQNYIKSEFSNCIDLF